MAEALAVRELYCPAHFGNTYEVALRNEMSKLLVEARHWGYTRYSDWFDTVDLNNVYEPGRRWFDTPEAMWAKKFMSFECACHAGFELGLCVTPNHVFADQVTAQRAAVKGDHVFGQLVCPSKADVPELILANYRNLFQDFSDRGLRLGSVSGLPYDYGGCLCDECSPWVVTFGRLFKQIVELARDFFGEVDADLWGWGWTDEDHEAFSTWANRLAPGFFRCLAYHLPNGVTDYAVRPVPKGCGERAFVNIAYGEENRLGDVYGHRGATVAPERLERTVRYLMERKADGLMVYSEGAFDDVNKAIVGGIASGRYPDSVSVLRAYAQRYLGGDVEAWVDCAYALGSIPDVDTSRARALFDKASADARPGWRLEQLRGRLVMCEANATVEARSQWDAERIQAAQDFWNEKERLFREVWGLGLLRHILRFDSLGPVWQDEYLALARQARQPSAVEGSEEA